MLAHRKTGLVTACHLSVFKTAEAYCDSALVEFIVESLLSHRIRNTAHN